MLQAKQHGYNVLLCTYEDSFVSKMAREHEIEILPFKLHLLNKFFSYHTHYSLRTAFKKSQIDIVHCYDFNFLCSLSLQLKRKNLTALVMTQGQTIDKPLQRFWYRPIISRIDSLILMNKNLKEDAIGNLGLPNKKIEYFGLGIKNEDVLNPLEVAINFDLYSSHFLAGTYITPRMNNLTLLIPLLYGLKVINAKAPVGVKSKLVFVSPVEYQSMEILPPLMRLIQQLDLKEDILFVTTKDFVGVITRLNLWISHSPDELIEDFVVSSLIHEVPVIFPRNYCTRDFLEEYEGVGETYKIHDSRELRDKWEKIIIGEKAFKEKTRLYKFFIEREHSFKNYKTQLMNLYAKTVQRRIRLFRGTKK